MTSCSLWFKAFPDYRESGTFSSSATLFLAMASASVASAAPVTSAAGMAAAITHLVTVEMIESFIPMFRMWTSVAVMWIEAIINVAAELVGAVEPGTGSDEHATVEPLRPVVSIGGAVIWGEIVKAIRANWLCSDIDGDLGRSRPWHA
jgi:hypothetical protein